MLHNALLAAERPVTPKIYIAAIHWNNEAILRSHWFTSILDLAKHLGRDNVFISIQESGSWDDSESVLQGLDNELEKAKIRRPIILDPTTHLDKVSKPPADSGWISTPRGKIELRRIPYLARLRNLVLEPLREMQAAGEVFDYILFPSDVVFSRDDVYSLLGTNGGYFAAACALDFSDPPKFDDTFALRDAEGHEALMMEWPCFRAGESRRAMKMSRPVPVASCCNGMGMCAADAIFRIPIIGTLQLRRTYTNPPSRHAHPAFLRLQPLIPRHLRRPRQLPPRRLRVFASSTPITRSRHRKASGSIRACVSATMAKPMRLCIHQVHGFRPSTFSRIAGRTGFCGGSRVRGLRRGRCGGGYGSGSAEILQMRRVEWPA